MRATAKGYEAMGLGMETGRLYKMALRMMGGVFING